MQTKRFSELMRELTDAKTPEAAVCVLDEMKSKIENEIAPVDKRNEAANVAKQIIDSNKDVNLVGLSVYEGLTRASEIVQEALQPYENLKAEFEINSNIIVGSFGFDELLGGIRRKQAISNLNNILPSLDC